jgi:molybdate transport system regulatory protein
MSRDLGEDGGTSRPLFEGANRKLREVPMKYGARNRITAKVKSIKSDEIMSLVKFDITTPAEAASVLTTESLQDLGLREGDTVELVIKAVHVLPVK